MKNIIVFGTYDIFHPGHEHFFKQAKKLGDYLIVVIARDIFVKKTKRKNPINSETKRLKNVRKSKMPNKVILGSKIYNFYQTLRTHKVDTIALGYDQKPHINELKTKLRRHKLKHINIVRLKSYKPNIYKTKLLLKYLQ